MASKFAAEVMFSMLESNYYSAQSLCDFNHSVITFKTLMSV